MERDARDPGWRRWRRPWVEEVEETLSGVFGEGGGHFRDPGWRRPRVEDVEETGGDPGCQLNYDHWTKMP